MVLPPDLSRLGDDLTRAAARSLAARRHRRGLIARVAATAVAGVLAVAVLSPAALGPAQLSPAPVGTSSVVPTLISDAVTSSCDQGRGSHFGLPACGHAVSREPAPLRSIMPRRPAAARI
jgi:hypothetical protein